MVVTSSKDPSCERFAVLHACEVFLEIVQMVQVHVDIRPVPIHGLEMDPASEILCVEPAQWQPETVPPDILGPRLDCGVAVPPNILLPGGMDPASPIHYL